MMNGNNIGHGHSQTYRYVSNGWDELTISIQSTLDVKAGDKLWIQISSMSNSYGIYSGTYNHFTGFLLEEDISQSMKVV